ncbi:GNAT family N-acetyltransferase [Paenibacillus methanolicus]|uniref:Ribosomal protein S18 acetylase RimI-like enzyme n=1 Tax=Paenibacillus methanolicus TaxID=582686 RepID=A0A5S5C699_9BACL|nr:GNAT family N-acetyltransferase [Paenibacillus methanolicus]TYP74002.1 ribosomal protein S18 acetylase RimI-like enzyme [Paenibacillus methanolicus]
MALRIYTLQTLQETALWREAFAKGGLDRPIGYYADCFEANRGGTRITVLAEADGAIAGCGHVLKASGYALFREAGIAEVNDLNVLPEFRRRGVGGRLLDELEAIASRRYAPIGLGVGLDASYVPAQRMYANRGYGPDDRGLRLVRAPVEPGGLDRTADRLLYWAKALSAK